MKLNDKNESFESTDIENKKEVIIEVKCEPKWTIPELIPAFGIIMMVLNAVSYSTGSLIIKLLPHLHSLEVLFFRSLFQFVFNLIIVLINKNPIIGNPDSRFNLIQRGIFGTVSTMGSFMAFSLIPLSDATTIQFTSPVFVTFFAYYMLKEPITLIQMVTSIITLTGVLFITKPEFIFGSQSHLFQDNRTEGFIYSFLGAFGNAMAIITVRKLKSTPVALVVMWYGFIIMVSTLVTLLIIGQLCWPTDWKTWALLLTSGVCGVLEQTFMTIALRYESAGPASIARTISIVLAFVWDLAVLNGKFEWTAAVGAILVSTGVISLGLFKYNGEKSKIALQLKYKLCCFRK